MPGKLRPKLSALPVLVVGALLLLASPGGAADYPDIVSKALADATAQCTGLGGKPGDESAMASVDDLDGNGGEDWILDYRKQVCKGAVPPFCGSAGCTLQIYLWQRDSRWDLVFDENVQAWNRTTFGGRPGLSVSFHGSKCNRTGSQRCNKTYLFERGKLRPR